MRNRAKEEGKRRKENLSAPRRAAITRVQRLDVDEMIVLDATEVSNRLRL